MFKIVRKTFISTFCDFFMTLFLKNDINVPDLQKIPYQLKYQGTLFLVGVLKVIDEHSRIRIRNGIYILVRGILQSADSDPYQYVTDPKHCFLFSNYFYMPILAVQLCLGWRRVLRSPGASWIRSGWVSCCTTACSCRATWGRLHSSGAQILSHQVTAQHALMENR
jgi:hypothetical protein